MKVLSLFDGISCGILALIRNNINVDEYHAFEIDKYAVTVSNNNFPEIIRHGDVFEDDFRDFNNFDLLIGGSPCTYWSISNRNREISADGEVFKLFMQYVRALYQSNCKYFLYENNYSIHKNIKERISEELGTDPIMINSALVSAQQRKRCYWTNIPNIELPKDKGILVKDILENPENIIINDIKGKSRTIKAQYANTSIANPVRTDGFGSTVTAVPIRIGQIGKGSQGQRIYSVYGKSINLQANGGGGGARTGLYKIDLPDGDYIIRKLTPIEAERLQTLPDNYTAGISDNQRYKCIGNGWTADVISHILKSLSECVTGTHRQRRVFNATA